MTTPATIKRNTSFKVEASGQGTFNVYTVGNSSYRWGLSQQEAVEFALIQMEAAQGNYQHYEKEKERKGA